MDKIKLGDIHLPKGINFLIIDDQPMIRELLENSLSRMGFDGKIHHAGGLREAQDIFNDDSVKIDFIVLDWRLDDGTGLQFIKALRKLNEYDQIPVLVISGILNDQTLDYSIQKGATGYLKKPWAYNDLVEKLALCWLNSKIVQLSAE